MNSIKFSDYKDKIVEQISERSVHLQINEPTILIDGFFNQPIQMEISSEFRIGGPTIPMVALVGKNSGQVYWFALKALLPSINLN